MRSSLQRSLGSVALVALLALGLSWVTGCRKNPVDPGEVAVSAGQTAIGLTGASPLAGPAGSGQVRFKLDLPGFATASGWPRAGIRASTKAAARVVFRLRGLNIHNNSAQWATPVEQQVEVAPDGSAEAVFETVDPLTTVGQVQITGADLNGVTDFQGAHDVQPGANVLAVNPTGSGMTSEVAAHVIQSLVNSPTVAANLPATNLNDRYGRRCGRSTCRTRRRAPRRSTQWCRRCSTP